MHSDSLTLKAPLTGEPDAGQLHVRFGGRGKVKPLVPTPIPARRDEGNLRAHDPVRAGTRCVQPASQSRPPYPGTELYEQAKLNGWFVKQDKTDLVEQDGFQQSALEYPGLSKEEIFESVERFYHAYYLRPKPILRIIKTMLEDKDVFVRRCREGYEFFKSMAQRRSDLEAAKATTS